MKIFINGVGRIGRHLVRQAINDPLVDLVGVNDLNPSVENICYMLKYDTHYGPMRQVSSRGSTINVEGKSINYSNVEKVTHLDLRDIDILIDCTGVSSHTEDIRALLSAGMIKKALITHCAPGVDFDLILGANDHGYDNALHHLISSSICDSTALAPVLEVISDTFGIESGFVTTLHPWLSYQNLTDGPSSSWSVPGTIHHHFALGRSAVGNLIPKPTSAIEACDRALPHRGYASLLGSFSIRVPTAVVGSADLTVNTVKPIDVDSFERAIKDRQSATNWEIFSITREPIVSSDFLGNSASASVDFRWVSVVGGKCVKVVLWYDNEFGYACRVLDQAKFIAGSLA